MVTFDWLNYGIAYFGGGVALVVFVGTAYHNFMVRRYLREIASAIREEKKGR